MSRKSAILPFFAILLLLALPAGAGAQAQPRGNVDQRTEEASRVEDAVRTFFGVLRPEGKGASPAGPTKVQLDALYDEAMKAERTGDVRRALSLYEKVLDADYSDPRVHMAIGRVLEPSDPALSIFHYQNAFRFSISAAAEEVPALEVMRRFLVGRYLQYALPIENPATSSNLLELAQSLAPEDPRIHAHLASAYFLQGMYRRSVQENQNALALGLENGAVLVNLAAAYVQLGEKEGAERALNAALNLDDRDITEVLHLVRLAESSETIVTFSKLLGKAKVDDMMKNSVKGRLESALKLWEQGDQKSALEVVRAAGEKHPKHSHAMVMLGDLLRSRADTEGALVAYQSAVQRNPENPLVLPRLGDLAYDRNRFEEAAQYYMQAMDQSAGRIQKVDMLDRTAVALAQNGKHVQALDLLDKWLKANPPEAPGSFELSVRRAGILADASRTREAELLLRGLVDRDKLNPAGYIVLSTFYKERDNEKKAVQVINDGIIRIQAARDADPLDPAYYRDLARLYRAIGKTENARQAELEGGLRTVEKRYFANALFAENADSRAFQVLKSWVNADPRNPEAILSYAWLAAKLNQEVPLALSRVENLALEYPEMDMAPIRRTRSYLHYASGNFEKAIEDIKAFLTNDNLSQASFFHRLWGMAAEALNRRAEALTHYKKAVELDPEENSDLHGRVAGLSGR